MRTADMVKSKFFRAVDVQGQRPLVLTIADVTEELMGRGGRQEVKCFLWFQESPKGLQLNKSRVAVLEMAYGPDSVLWTGKRVRLSFDPTVMFGGRAVGGVKLETPAGVVYTPSAEGYPGWGEVPQGAAGRPPAPIWDEKRQQWITPTPPPQSAAPGASPAVPARPPAPVWDDATGKWVTVDPGTGEIAGQMPAGRGLAALAGRTTDPSGDFDDDIPF
jgi:hypothetical protein